ncbi:AP2 domain transcription factor AP2VI-3 [Toxoplasma gondii GAB2-2007-GAL-DOM2]|uniref:AP2 domain transcription factor AP2VI-3 n=4 Tax=Toxoplasma gondii TaxID=5811 RepID=S7VMX6_TOXGG|nr:AP2 domain transcription factor AP2VI-3 [Toxoplasma gondii GT1]KAF4643130.1 AP2 domain transcription factor AP2VI-3 [Toxoplasma gondii]KFG36560.1 AP2 domain transcription factor AP2VI-3 [Toxoplasma gondii GAB2-2007-GAL-DOM2]KFG51594.1 AP2 domain transcription factor AP2VI-3 [Toxoplasma gondii FOU]
MSLPPMNSVPFECLVSTMPPQTLSDSLAHVPTRCGKQLWIPAGDARLPLDDGFATAIALMPPHSLCPLRDDAIAVQELWSSSVSRCKASDSFVAPSTSLSPFLLPTVTHSGVSDVTASTCVSSRASQVSSFESGPALAACDSSSSCHTQDEECAALSPSPSPGGPRLDFSSSAAVVTLCRESAVPIGAAQPPSQGPNVRPAALVQRATAAVQRAAPESLQATLAGPPANNVSYTASEFECASLTRTTAAPSTSGVAAVTDEGNDHLLNLVSLSPSYPTQGHLQVHRSCPTPCLPAPSRLGEFAGQGFPQKANNEAGLPWGLERYCYPELCTPTVAGSEESLHFASCHPETFGFLEASSRCMDAFCCGTCSRGSAEHPCATLCAGGSLRRPVVRDERGHIPLSPPADSRTSRDLNRLPGFRSAGDPDRDPALLHAGRGLSCERGKDLSLDDGGDSLCNPYQELQNLTEGSPLHERSEAFFPYLRLENEAPGYTSPYTYQALDSPSAYKWRALTASPRESRLSRSISPSTWDGLSIYLSESDPFYQDLSLPSTGDTPGSPLVESSGVARLLTTDEQIGEPLTPTDVSSGAPSRLSTRSELLQCESSQLPNPKIPICAASQTASSEELIAHAEAERTSPSIPVSSATYDVGAAPPETGRSSVAKTDLRENATPWWEGNAAGQPRAPEQLPPKRCLPEACAEDATSLNHQVDRSRCPDTACSSGRADVAATCEALTVSAPGATPRQLDCRDSFISSECSGSKGAVERRTDAAGIPPASSSPGRGFVAIQQVDSTVAGGTTNACPVGNLGAALTRGTALESIPTAGSSLSSESGAAAPAPFLTVWSETQGSSGSQSPVSCSSFSPAPVSSRRGNGDHVGLPSISTCVPSCSPGMARSASLPANKSTLPCGENESYQHFAHATNFSPLVLAPNVSTGGGTWHLARGVPEKVAAKPAVTTGLPRCTSASFVTSVSVGQRTTQAGPSVPSCSQENFSVRQMPFVAARTPGDGQLPMQATVLQQLMPQLAKASPAGTVGATSEVNLQGVSAPPQFGPPRVPLNNVAASSNLLAASAASHVDSTNVSAMKYPYFCPPAAHVGRATVARQFGNVSCLAKDESVFEEHEPGEAQQETAFDFGGPTAVPIRTRKGFRKPLPLPQEMLACPGDVGDAERGNEPVLQYDAASREWRVFWVEDRLARYKVFQAKKFGKERAQQLAEDWYHRARAGHVSVGSRGLRGVQSQGAPKAKKIKTES